MIGPKFLNNIDFFTSLQADFGRNVLNVWKIVKNRVKEQIAKKKHETRLLTNSTKLLASIFKNYGFLIGESGLTPDII